LTGIVRANLSATSFDGLRAWLPIFQQTGGPCGIKGNSMKKIATLFALSVYAQHAFAAGQDCRAIEKAGERLACYDAASATKKDKPGAVETDASRAAYQDPLIAEDARIAAKLKNICRGC
jgi:hypothetical protein